jgi:hypothetical protein
MTARQRLEGDPQLRSHVRARLGVSSVGMARLARELRRVEAEERNAKTPHRLTRAHREGFCVEHGSRQRP